MNCSTPGFPILHYLLDLAQTHVHWVGDSIQPSNPLSSPSPPAFNLSQHQGLSQWVCSFHQVAKVLELQFQPSIPTVNIQRWFPLGWLDLLAVQGTLKSLLHHHSSKASILQSSAFFMVQLSHPYTTTEKTIALTRWIFVSKIMSLLFNTLSRFVIAFLRRSKCLLFHGCSHCLWWFWSQEKNTVTVSTMSLFQLLTTVSLNRRNWYKNGKYLGEPYNCLSLQTE